jgi:hypothetical protein
MGRRDPAWRAFVEHVRATRGHLPPQVRAVVLELATALPDSSYVVTLPVLRRTTVRVPSPLSVTWMSLPITVPSFLNDSPDDWLVSTSVVSKCSWK